MTVKSTAKMSQKTKQRREMILSAALELFLKNGYENTSLGDIIAISGGSLSSVYSLFGGKDGLFHAIIERGVSEFVAGVRRGVEAHENAELREFLTAFANAYVQMAFEHESLAIKRLIVSESFKQNMSVIKIFHEHGVIPLHAILTDYFARSPKTVGMSEEEANLAAFRFCLILEEPIAYRIEVLGEKIFTTEGEKRAWVKNCVNFFLKGIGE